MNFKYAFLDEDGKQVEDIYVIKAEGDNFLFNRRLKLGEKVMIHYFSDESLN